MYKCGMCGKVVPPKTKCIEIVIKKRKKVYPFREGVNRPATWKEDRQERFGSTNDFGGSGFEAAETAKACPQCVRSLQAAEQVGEVVKTV
jgi:hypothetical protein